MSDPQDVLGLPQEVPGGEELLHRFVYFHFSLSHALILWQCFDLKQNSAKQLLVD